MTLPQELHVGPYRIVPEQITYSATAMPESIRGTTATSWRVQDASGRSIAFRNSRSDAIASAEQMIADSVPIAVTLANGKQVTVLTGVLSRFRGLDEFGYQVYAMDEGSEHMYAVTPCCGASGKGVSDGVACRACYVLVDDYFGGFAKVAVPVLT